MIKVVYILKADTIKIKFTATHVKLENIARSRKINCQCANWFRLAEHDRVPTNAKYSNPRISFDGLKNKPSETVKEETAQVAAQNLTEVR